MNEKPKVVIATRGSALAMVQAHFILDLCQLKMPSWDFEIKVIKTTGDKLQTASLANPDKSLPKGLFTKEIEEALLDKTADIAVHSLKDLPTELPEGLKLGAVPQRKDARDILVTRKTLDTSQSGVLTQIPKDAVVATSSLRRASQMKQICPEIITQEIRGNVGTRLKKLSESDVFFATILASAGFERLGYSINSDGSLSGEDVPEGLYAYYIPINEMLPCVGQAALGIEVREKDPLIDELCIAINDNYAWYEVHAEREFLRTLGGGCQSPIAGYGQYSDGQLSLNVMADFGHAIYKQKFNTSLCEAEKLGALMAELALDTKAQSSNSTDA